MSKKKKDLFDELFKNIFEEFESFQEFGGGYSISVVSSGGKTKVHVKADKNTDVKKLRRELERMYPGAEIIIEGGKIEIEEGEELEHEATPKKKSLIEVIEERKIDEEENK
jgi:peptidyl-tRNA hydrolase